MKKNKTSKKEYYVAVIKATNDILVSTSMKDIADHLSINVKTVSRQMNLSSVHTNDVYTLWSGITANTRKTGFALK